MRRRLMALSLGIIAVLFLLSCKGREEKTAAGPAPSPAKQTQQVQTQFAPGMQQAVPQHGSGISKGQLNVVVPESVKGKWAAVRLSIQDKKENKRTEVTVNLNSEYKIPDSDLKIVVGEFLPGFTMNEGIITSASSELTNPAVGIRVYAGDKQIFPAPGKQWAWLFSKMPDVHPLEHPRFGITLKEGARKN